MSGDTRAAAGFDGSALAPVAFALVLTAYSLGLTAVEQFLLGVADLRSLGFAPIAVLVALVWVGALVGTTAVAFRYDGRSLREVLPSVRETAVAVVAVAGAWVALSALVAGVGLALGERAVGATLTHPEGFVRAFLPELVAFGIAEEIAWRGYFQNRVVARLGGRRDRARLVAAVVGATAVFALYHVPNRLLTAGHADGAVAVAIGQIFASALLLALAYELTRNLAFVALVHGLYNAGALLFTATGHAPVQQLAYYAGGFAVTVLAAVVYRRWALRATPERFDEGRSRAVPGRA